VLGTLGFTYHREPAAVYLAEVRDDHDVYDGGSICHPGFLARQANAVLHLNVQLGPWIHVGTTAHHDGDLLEVYGRVAADTSAAPVGDVEVEVGGDLIWQPRSGLDAVGDGARSAEILRAVRRDLHGRA
jgi:hypothetical protein